MATIYSNGTITHVIPNEPGLPTAHGIDVFLARPPHAIIEPDANDPAQRRVPFNIFNYQRSIWILNHPDAVNVITDSDETDTDDDVSKYTHYGIKNSTNTHTLSLLPAVFRLKEKDKDMKTKTKTEIKTLIKNIFF